MRTSVKTPRNAHTACTTPPRLTFRWRWTPTTVAALCCCPLRQVGVSHGLLPWGYRLVFSPRCANERCPRLLVCCCPRGRWQLHVRVLPIHSSRRRRPSDLLQPSSCGAYPIIVGGCAGKLSDVRGSQVSTRYNNARVEWESPELVVNERVRKPLARPLHAGQVTVVVVYTPSHRSPAGHHSLSNIPRVRHPSE